ncbi:MAG: FMN-binding glutamate synthase family protein [Gammaproteobacteria bacterium]|nr:FMN-binding glutamate synthase family protein [Gammaproteobacteria bacterium]MBT8133258.1 FMN-binding glutamate synthase family protein [Gammaproteobacteria bacterium]NNJ49617.1 FMN-binding glutamate synthase family protein [Gammaproteobacteria bacterium]
MFSGISFGLEALGWISTIFIFVVGLFILFLIGVYIADVTQTKQAIRRNYPVIGHLRYYFEHIGTFFRQYFFTMDREEMPFNRAQRSWVYRAAKDIDNTVSFGSTRDIKPSGTILFVNTAFPKLGKDAVDCKPVTIGEGSAEKPFTANSFFNISGMSYGAISKPAVQALSFGAKKANAWMNTGEGGLSPYHLEGGADIVFQIGTAKYGVRDKNGNLSDEKLREIAAHENVRMFEIKISQGAKPGKGGILPAAKVNQQIAEIRGIERGADSISPNRHPEIANNDDLIDMINHIREVTGKPVGFKAVIGDRRWMGEFLAAVNKRGKQTAPDFITIDSADGGTGAAPMSLMDYVGMPINESLPRVIDKISEAGLRDRIKVIASGKLINPAEVAWALCVGADFVTSARGFMFSLGCIQALQCHKNTCPTGITTHDKKLQRGLVAEQKSTRVANYIKNIRYEVGIIAHSCGVQHPRQLSRQHARIVQQNGTSSLLADIYPDKMPHD